MTRKIYKALGIWWIVKATKRGPSSLIRQRIRATLLGKTARFLRRILKP